MRFDTGIFSCNAYHSSHILGFRLETEAMHVYQPGGQVRSRKHLPLVFLSLLLPDTASRL